MEEFTIEELERELYGTPEVNETANSETEEPSDEETEEIGNDNEFATTSFEDTPFAEEESEEEEVIQTDEETLEATKTQSEEAEYWKHRFSTYKSSNDVTKFNLRKDVANLKQDNAKLLKEIRNLKEYIQSSEVNSKASYFTQDDIDILGEEGIAAIQKSIDAAVNPLQQQLNRANQEKEELMVKEAESISRQAVVKFFANLEALVPDYEKINVDPAFIKYLERTDGMSGYTYHELFRIAEQEGNAYKVANFFNAFLDEQRGNKNARTQKLDANISPRSTASASNPKGKGKREEPITMEFIDKFYDDVMKGGVYTPKEAERIEARIDKAMIGGKIQ